MAITFGSNLIHFNTDLALVDSEQTFGGFKNHIESIVGFHGLVDAYTDNSTDYFNQDLWGKFKPYGTFIYAVNGASLFVKSDQDVIDEGLLLDSDYFEVQDDDGNTINVVIDTVGSSPAYFVYVGNTDYLTTGPNTWDSTSVNVYETFTDDEGVSRARAKNWKNLSEISGGSGGTLVDLSIIGQAFSAPSSLSEANPTSLSQVVLGDVTGNAQDGYEIELPTHEDIRKALSGSPFPEVGALNLPAVSPSLNSASIGYVDGNNGYFHLRVNPSALLEVATLTTTGQVSAGGGLVVSDNSTVFTATELDVTVGQTVQDEQPTFNVYSNTINLQGLGTPVGTILTVSGSDNTVGTTTAAALVDSAYGDLVETIEGTVNQITVTGATGTEADQFDGDVVVSLADQLILGNVEGGSVTVGGTSVDGGFEVGLTVHGDTVITGSLQIDGGLVNTTSSEVSFEDTILSLGVARDDDGDVEATTWATVSGNGAVGIEAFAGASSTVASDLQYSRPYIVYDYVSSGEPIPGTSDTYGKWVLANHYTEDGGTWTAVQGAILTSVDLSLVDLSVNDNDLHAPVVADNNIKHLVSSYQLTNFTTSTIGGDTVERRFGRVSRVTHTYTAEDAGEAVVLNHGLETDDVMVIGVVVDNGGLSLLPTPGNVIHPKSQVVSGEPGQRAVKVGGTVNGDQIKFMFIG